MFSVIADVFNVMSADPSNETPDIFLAFCRTVALAALPVVEPDEPLVLPVTLPVKFPVTLPVTSPVTSPVKLPVIVPDAPIVPTLMLGVPVKPAAVVALVAAIPNPSTYDFVMCACTSDWLGPVKVNTPLELL